MSEKKKHVCLTIAFRNNRIRITKETLLCLGDPRFVQLLINPETRMLAIRCVDKMESGDQTHRVKYQNSHDCYFEMYSKPLVEKFGDVFEQFDKGSTYRFYGEAYPTQQLACFHLSDAVKIDPIISEVNNGDKTENQ